MAFRSIRDTSFFKKKPPATRAGDHLTKAAHLHNHLLEYWFLKSNVRFFLVKSGQSEKDSCESECQNLSWKMKSSTYYRQWIFPWKRFVVEVNKPYPKRSQCTVLQACNAAGSFHTAGRVWGRIIRKCHPFCELRGLAAAAAGRMHFRAFEANPFGCTGGWQ